MYLYFDIQLVCSLNSTIKIAVRMEAAIARIEEACRRFTHPATRQQGESELLAINEALSPADIPAVTIAVLEQSTEFYAHFHLLTLLISTISTHSNPELSQHLLNYILNSKKLPVYLSVKAHLALVKATSLENLVVILNGISTSSPAAAVGISRAILEEQQINADEDDQLQISTFENNVLPILSNIILQSLTLSQESDVMKYTVPALEALLTYRNDQNDLIFNTATESMHASVLHQFARPEVLQLIMSVNTYDNETLGFVVRKVLNAVFSSTHPQDKNGWTLTLIKYLETASSMDIGTRLSCHKSLLQSHNLDVILSNDGPTYIQNLFQLGGASLSQQGDIFADFLACWLSILRSIETDTGMIPTDLCTEIVRGWLNTKVTLLDNSQEDDDDDDNDLDDVETELKVILDPLAQLGRMNPIPILENVIEKVNSFNVLIESSGYLSDSNYDRLQTLVLFTGSLIADEGVGETPSIPNKLVDTEHSAYGLSTLIGSLAKLTTLFTSERDLSPNVAGIIWKSFWARFLRTYGLNDNLALPAMKDINNVGFYSEFQNVIQHSLQKWKAEEDVVDGLAETIQSLPMSSSLINFGNIIDIILSNMPDWPYKLDKKLVSSCGIYISRMDRNSEERQRYKISIFYFISNMFTVIDDEGFKTNSQKHPYITHIKMGLNALVGLSETLDPYTYLDTVEFIKQVLSKLLGVVQTHYLSRIDIQLDILYIFNSVIQNLDLGMDFDEAGLRTLPEHYVAPVMNMWFEYYLSIKYERGVDDSDEFSEGVEIIFNILRNLASTDGNYSDINNDKTFAAFVFSYLDPLFNISQSILESNLKLQAISVDLVCNILRSYPRSINMQMVSTGVTFSNATLLNFLNQVITSQWSSSHTLIDGVESYMKYGSEKNGNGGKTLSQVIAIPLNAILLRIVISRNLRQRLVMFILSVLNTTDVHAWLDRKTVLLTITNNLKCPESSKDAIQASLQSALMSGIDLTTYKSILNELSSQVANIMRGVHN
ncbi:hypothetical protein E3Q11_03914 [Wallemia mellicola]|nr:hypothetical protein E3Q11_03914 [Wallemia mellicola]TIC74840.1 hypothetical protein E3Q00_01499 [Wallemia mellicola]